MNKICKILLCVVLIIAFSAPVFANGTQTAKSKHAAVSKVTGSIYSGGAYVLRHTESALTNCLRTCFSLFNPCLDTVKGCASIALIPIEKPLDYIEGRFKAKPAKRAVTQIPEPKKPEVPK